MSANTYTPAGYCPHCGYAIDPGVCTECGRTVAARELDAEPSARGGHRLRVLAALLIMAVMASFLAWFGFHGPVQYVLGGHVFTEGFDRSHAGTVMDQPTIGKWYIIFTFFSAVAFAGMALARWIGYRRTRAGYWSYLFLAVCICLCLIINWTIPFTWLVKYIQAMGYTPRRVNGLIYGIAGYLMMLAFIGWAAWSPRRRKVRTPVNGH